MNTQPDTSVPTMHASLVEGAVRLPISAVIITLNCVKMLGETLASLSFVDEIVVVDSGSTDGTIELAQQYGARVVQQTWLGFGPQKQFGVMQAKHDWVLCVDSDERVSEALQDAMRQVFERGVPTTQAYRFARCNRFMGRYLRHGEGYPDWSLRLFHRGYARWSDDAVHEKVLTNVVVQTLEGDLLHDSAETMSRYLAKQDRYTTLAAQTAVAAGRRPGLLTTALRAVLSPLVRFIKFYVVRRGFLDGVPGLVHIGIGCYTAYAKYVKMYRLSRQRDSNVRQEAHK